MGELLGYHITWIYIYINEKVIFNFIDVMNGWIETDYGLLKTVDGGKSWIWE
jgi:hypothetical protein